MSEKLKQYIALLLTVSVLITIGFAFGRVTERRSLTRGSDADSPQSAITGTENQVVVYYLHSTFRCATCNNIETMTHNLLKTDFSEELDDGRILWRELDFQANESVAQRYQVIASCVVIARVGADGREEYRRVDEVWTLMRDPPAFNAFLGKIIRNYLGEGENK